MVQLGKVVASDSHLQYRCRVYGPGEVEHTPAPADHPLGGFVHLATGPDSALIGVICDTVLQNPEFGAYGPRLSTAEETAIFSPDYVDEACTLITIAVIGQVSAHGVDHQAPPTAVVVNCEVGTMSPDEVCAFHLTPEGFRMGYLPTLLSLAKGSPVYTQAVLKVLHDLELLFPDGEAGTRLRLLSQSLGWRLRIEGMG